MDRIQALDVAAVALSKACPAVAALGGSVLDAGFQGMTVLPGVEILSVLLADPPRPVVSSQGAAEQVPSSEFRVPGSKSRITNHKLSSPHRPSASITASCTAGRTCLIASLARDGCTRFVSSTT